MNASCAAARTVSAAAIAVASGLVGAAGCGGSTGDQEAGPDRTTVTRAEVEADGEAWPFTTDTAVLACEANAVTVTVDGTTYALNGIAMGREVAPDLDRDNPIWLDDPASVEFAEQNRGIEPWKISAGGLIQAGLALCEGHG